MQLRLQIPWFSSHMSSNRQKGLQLTNEYVPKPQSSYYVEALSYGCRRKQNSGPRKSA